MIFTTGTDGKWKTWFAWYPVQLAHHTNKWAWLQRIERRVTNCFTEYRLIGEELDE